MILSLDFRAFHVAVFIRVAVNAWGLSASSTIYPNCPDLRQQSFDLSIGYENIVGNLVHLTRHPVLERNDCLKPDVIFVLSRTHFPAKFQTLLDTCNGRALRHKDRLKQEREDED